MTVRRLCVVKSAGDSTEALSFEVGGSNTLDGDIRKVTHQRGKRAHTPKRELARAKCTPASGSLAG